MTYKVSEESSHRQVITDRSFQMAAVQARLKTIVHQHLKPDDEGDRATLLIFEFNFFPKRADRRIRRANIQLQFSNPDTDAKDLRICSLAPSSKTAIVRYNETDSATQNSSAGLQGIPGVFGMKVFSDKGVPSGARWHISEAEDMQRGIPALIQTAVMIARSSESPFLMSMDISVEVSGISFRTARSTQVIKIDPVVSLPGNLEVGTANLASTDLDLYKLISDTVTQPVFPDPREVRDTEREETEERAAVEARLDVSSTETVLPANNQPYFYVQLWNIDPNGESGTRRTPESMRLDVPGFANLLSEEWPRQPNSELLAKYFSWLDLNQVQVAKEEQSWDREDKICSILVRKSESVGCKSFKALNTFIEDNAMKEIVNYFGLPEEYYDSRRNDGGTCQRTSPASKDSHGNPIESHAYMIQTPFYSKGFWSLILLSNQKHLGICRVAGVVQADASINISDILHRVKARSSTSHPLLLLLELYKDHFLTTSEAFKSVLGKIEDVDAELQDELNHASASKTNKMDANHARLSQMLHQARMDISELARRRYFEKKLGDQLLEDLEDDIQLADRIKMYSELSRSHELDIKSLPDRIASQTTVLYSLIAQSDTRLQYALSREAIRDSKAMKTLSILTILFLPGAFVATLFSTNMFKFRPGQEVWIYFVVVVPVTCLLMTGWVLWLKNSPYTAGAGYSEKGEKQV